VTEPCRIRGILSCLTGIVFSFGTTAAWAQSAAPVLDSVFPPGGQAGKSFEIAISGSGLEGAVRIVCNHSGISFESLGKGRFRAKIAGTVPAGAYELRAFGPNGLSSPRTFTVGIRPEVPEVEPNDSAVQAQPVSLNRVVNGRIAQGGDVDRFRFAAKKGQRIVIECSAERIDSRLRAVLELYDSRGRRLAVNRGDFGIDPLISFKVPEDGMYVLQVFDLVFSGSAEHFYRLEIDTGPRVVFAVPAVLQRGKTTRVTLYGWNLGRKSANDHPTSKRTHETKLSGTSQNEHFDRVDVEITPPSQLESRPIPIRLRSTQIGVDGFAFHYPGSRTPIFLGVADVPAVRERAVNSTPRAVQTISVPSEVSGQLTAGEERDQYAIDAKRGEVLWIEAFGQRIGSPVDLDVGVLDATGSKVLAHFRDTVKNVGGKRFPSSHLDPAGRWVAPADGRYVIMIRNLVGGFNNDPRRVYWLSIRREVPDFRLVVVPRRDTPAALNVPRGGRLIADVLAFRRRGLTGSIRVSAKHLPRGISCPDVWLGPGVTRAPIVISADENASSFAGTLDLQGYCDGVGSRSVQGASIVRTGVPNGSSRLATGVPLAVAGSETLRITADGHETRTHHLYGKLKVRHSPGSILDVAVLVDRVDAAFQSPVKLIGVGLPRTIRNQTATIPAGKTKGQLSLYLPPYLPVGTYTIAVRAETSVRAAATSKKTRTVTLFSNPVTFEVKPAAFVVQIDPEAPPRIRRGKIVRINYTARRINGFIGKIHTELDAPGGVIGLRGRGVTFVGQTESGTIQVIANDDAPLGRQRFLRLYAVGVVEDKPVFHGSCFLNVEIVK
jgi:hypothetical protein